MKLLLCGIILLIIGIVMLVLPDVFYQITESWKNDSSAEPSDFYKLHTRIGGILVSLVGVAGIIAHIIL